MAKTRISTEENWFECVYIVVISPSIIISRTITQFDSWFLVNDHKLAQKSLSSNFTVEKKAIETKVNHQNVDSDCHFPISSCFYQEIWILGNQSQPVAKSHDLYFMTALGCLPVCVFVCARASGKAVCATKYGARIPLVHTLDVCTKNRTIECIRIIIKSNLVHGK